MTVPPSSWWREHGMTLGLALAGWILAGLASYSAMSVRVATVEVRTNDHGRRLETVERTLQNLDRVSAKLEALVDRLDKEGK